MTARIDRCDDRRFPVENCEEIHGQAVNPCMIRSPFTHSLSLLAIGLSFTASMPTARAENPLEKLHRHILGELFGKRDDDCKDHEKKKKHKDSDRRSDDRDHRSYGGFSYTYNAQPVVEAPTYTQRYDAYEDPAPRTYAQPIPLEADVQAALQREGYYRGPIDGDLNSPTRAAIRDYQYDHRLAATGRIDRDLLRSLGL